MLCGERLRNLRLDAGKTQKEMSKIFNVTEGSYAHWEACRREPRYDVVKALAEYFNVTEEYLYGEDIKPKEKDKVRELIDELMNTGVLNDPDNIPDNIERLIMDQIRIELRMKKIKE